MFVIPSEARNLLLARARCPCGDSPPKPALSLPKGAVRRPGFIGPLRRRMFFVPIGRPLATFHPKGACRPQSHFIDLWNILGQPRPAEVDQEGSPYTFEKDVAKTSGGNGFAERLNALTSRGVQRKTQGSQRSTPPASPIPQGSGYPPALGCLRLRQIPSPHQRHQHTKESIRFRAREPDTEQTHRDLYSSAARNLSPAERAIFTHSTCPET